MIVFSALVSIVRLEIVFSLTANSVLGCGTTFRFFGVREMIWSLSTEKLGEHLTNHFLQRFFSYHVIAFGRSEMP
jgi:hypothetical protein